MVPEIKILYTDTDGNNRGAFRARLRAPSDNMVNGAKTRKKQLMTNR
jgi:hypothetical protein